MAQATRALAMTDDIRTNLWKLRPSRKPPVPGDVFTMGLPDDRFLFGRVISDDAISGMGVPGAILIYVYRVQTHDKMLPDQKELSPSRLLVPPMMTNRLPWSRGYFETVANVPLHEEDVLPTHCFLSAIWGTYHDEKGNQLPGPVEPVGDYELHSFATIDEEISDALLIPRANE